LIIDVSSPAGHSVNDGINPNLTSLQYSNVTDAVALVNKVGVGALMAKLDLKAASTDSTKFELRLPRGSWIISMKPLRDGWEDGQLPNVSCSQ
jgi:hypothetical protein